MRLRVNSKRRKNFNPGVAFSSGRKIAIFRSGFFQKSGPPDENARKACKPDFVTGGYPPWMTIPLTLRLPAGLQLPTRTCWGKSGPAPARRPVARGPYLALLPVGLAMPPLLPAARWALTPPFHPYPAVVSVSRPVAWRYHFCGAFRRVAPPGCYPAPSLFGVRTFLPVDPASGSRSGHPAFRASFGIGAERGPRQWADRRAEAFPA